MAIAAGQVISAAEILAAIGGDTDSGSNGTFVVLGSGLQVCWQTFTITPTASSWTKSSWTYPAAFASAPVVLVTPLEAKSDTLGLWGADAVTATTADVGLVRSNTTSTKLVAVAVGFGA